MMPASVLYFLCLFYSLLISKTTAYFGGFLLLTFFCFHVKQTIFSIRFVHCDTVFFSHKNRMEMCVGGSTKRDLWKNRIIERVVGASQQLILPA